MPNRVKQHTNLRNIPAGQTTWQNSQISWPRLIICGLLIFRLMTLRRLSGAPAATGSLIQLHSISQILQF